MEIIACIKTDKYLILSSDIIFIKEESWVQVTNPQQMTEILLDTLRYIKINFGDYKNIGSFISDKLQKNYTIEKKESMKPSPSESRESFMGGGL